MIRIKDTEEQMVIINDRTQAGTSLEQGSIDLLIQRQMSSDDHKGMEEGINEQEMILTNHYLLLGSEDLE